jgi:hypothetical protein
MKRNRFILATIPLIVVGILAFVKLYPRSVPLDECSPIYRQYAGQEGIEASYVRDYPVDDTTLVDVTLLHATTDSAWVSLCHEFVPYEFADSNKYINNLIHDTTSVTFRAVSKDDPHQKTKPDTTCDYNLLVISAKVKSVGIFQIETKSQFDFFF